ncbi:MAG: hypothetical protein ACREEY_17700 [Brevundimonas sp.]
MARFSTLPEAELAVALLRRQGVDARLADREMANSAPHLQLALGGLRVTAPDFQIVQARDVVARARRGEFGDLQSEENDEWMADATPGMVGELHESEVRGVMGSMKNIGRLLIIGFLALPVAGCLVTMLFAGA